MSKDHGLLNERYRPTTLENYVGNDHLKKSISKFLNQNDIPNLLFSGPAGSGKTTLAKLIVKNLDCEYILINASDENGIETIRDKVKGFASAASFTPLKVVILDEADFMTVNALASLRNVIEQFSRTTRFILTCNYVERIIDPIQSRCQVLKVVPPSKKECAIHVANILEQEGIEFEMEDLAVIINKCYPDLRKCLNSVQVSTHENKLTIDKEILVSSNYTTEVLKELSKSKPNFRTIRQIIADSGQNQFEELFKFLFDNSSKFAPDNEGSVVIYINEHQYQAQFALDKEINCMSLMAKLISLKG